MKKSGDQFRRHTRFQNRKYRWRTIPHKKTFSLAHEIRPLLNGRKYELLNHKNWHHFFSKSGSWSQKIFHFGWHLQKCVPNLSPEHLDRKYIYREVGQYEKLSEITPPLINPVLVYLYEKIKRFGLILGPLGSSKFMSNFL